MVRNGTITASKQKKLLREAQKFALTGYVLVLAHGEDKVRHLDYKMREREGRRVREMGKGNRKNETVRDRGEYRDNLWIERSRLSV